MLNDLWYTLFFFPDSWQRPLSKPIAALAAIHRRTLPGTHDTAIRLTMPVPLSLKSCWRTSRSSWSKVCASRPWCEMSCALWLWRCSAPSTRACVYTWWSSHESRSHRAELPHRALQNLVWRGGGGVALLAQFPRWRISLAHERSHRVAGSFPFFPRTREARNRKTDTEAA
jgi:hypothetical protein